MTPTTLSDPSPTEPNGRDELGRFTPGNTAAKGNPHQKRIQELKSAVLAAVTPKEVAELIKRLVQNAIAGDVAAAKVLLDRLFGREIIAHIEHDAAPGFVLILPSNGKEVPET